MLPSIGTTPKTVWLIQPSRNQYGLDATIVQRGTELAVMDLHANINHLCPQSPLIPCEGMVQLLDYAKPQVDRSRLALFFAFGHV